MVGMVIILSYQGGCTTAPSSQQKKTEKQVETKTQAETKSDPFVEAKKEIVRLPPSAFPQLPPEIRGQLEAKGCLIPQSFEGPEPHNVIRGEFGQEGQIDWAALCSKGGKTSLQVLWSGPSKCKSEFPEVDDLHGLQGMGNGKIEYSAKLARATPEYIVSHHEAYNVPLPVEPNHDGIELIFLGKASSISYCSEGEWLRLQGAD